MSTVFRLSRFFRLIFWFPHEGHLSHSINTCLLGVKGRRLRLDRLLIAFELLFSADIYSFTLIIEIGALACSLEVLQHKCCPAIGRPFPLRLRKILSRRNTKSTSARSFRAWPPDSTYDRKSHKVLSARQSSLLYVISLSLSAGSQVRSQDSLQTMLCSPELSAAVPGRLRHNT